MNNYTEALNYFKNDGVLAMVCVANGLKERDYKEALYFINEAIEKINEIKEIEARLGIDSITLFKALKNGIYVKDDLNGIEHRTVRGIEENGLAVINKICSYAECDEKYYYKDYGKTWALTREDLEK